MKMQIDVEEAALAIHKYLHDCDSDEVARLYEVAFTAVKPGSVVCDGATIYFEQDDEAPAEFTTPMLLGNTSPA